MHRETRPSFYLNVRKNLFYCHGCGRGGDVIRFVELSRHVSFRESVAHLRQQLEPAPLAELLQETAAFYRLQLHRHPEAAQYLDGQCAFNSCTSGLRDAALIEELGVGYAPGGNLRRHLVSLGYSPELLLSTGLINHQGRDAMCRRVIFPCCEHGQIVNLYGRSIGAAFPHRLLPRSKGGLFAWNNVLSTLAPSVRPYSTGARVESTFVILVEGLFDLAVLWQAGFRNTTCALGTHLTPAQLAQLCEAPHRSVYIVFDQDENHAGQQASRQLAQHLHCAGIRTHMVQLPLGHDPNSYFAAGATAADFTACLEQAQCL